MPLRVTTSSPLSGMQMGVAGLLDLNFLYPLDVRSAANRSPKYKPRAQRMCRSVHDS